MRIIFKDRGMRWMLQTLHLFNASVLGHQSPAVGGAHKFADQSGKFSKFHSAVVAAAAGKVVDIVIQS